MENEHPRGKLIGAAWLAATILLALILAGGLSYAVALIPWSAEVALLKQLPKLPTQECHLLPAAQTALEKLRVRLFPVFPDDAKFEVHLHLVKDPEVNAFAFLGGDVFVNSGLLKEARNADEVAGVLAHEITHVKNRDVLQGIFGQVAVTVLFAQIGDTTATAGILHQLMNMKFTSRQEEAADRGAVLRLQAAHIQTQALADFFTRLAAVGIRISLLSDHPDPKDRAKLAREAKVENPTPVLDAEEWKQLRAACQ